jgi:hypothetical protein
VDVLQVIQVALLIPSLLFIGLQVFLQRLQVKTQVFVQGHELYYLLTMQYVKLLREADTTPVLNKIWEALDKNRKLELDKAQAGSEWGAWKAMTPEEKQCYRYVRAVIEIFEQTFQLHQKDWIDGETWEKWRGWVVLAPQMRYFDYVVEDTESRLVKSFVDLLGSLSLTGARGGVTSDVSAA